MNLEKLKEARIEKDLSQGELAKKIGVTKMTYWRKENGHREFNRTEIENIKNALNLSLDDVNNIFFNKK